VRVKLSEFTEDPYFPTLAMSASLQKLKVGCTQK
jgi:hypothetical protein